MAKRLLTKCALIAAVAAFALALSPSDSFAAKKKAKPAGPGYCTSTCNAFHWCHEHWNDGKGASFPTLLMCHEGSCPPKC
jgi:hypothetical protein